MKKLEEKDFGEIWFDIDICLPEMSQPTSDQDEERGHRLKYKDEMKMLSLEEIINKYKITKDVAEKIRRRQSDVLAAYHEAVEEHMASMERYYDIKPFLKDKSLDSTVFSRYIHDDRDDKLLQVEYGRPKKWLIKATLGVFMSYVVFFSAVISGWSTNPPGWFDMICLAIVALIWLGVTTFFMWSIPSEYRARKIIKNILDSRYK